VRQPLQFGPGARVPEDRSAIITTSGNHRSSVVEVGASSARSMAKLVLNGASCHVYHPNNSIAARSYDFLIV